jgi:phospholipid/cholesterol/gamma-HCH transport system permease protein
VISTTLGYFGEVTCAFLGRWGEAIALLRRVVRLTFTPPVYWHNLFLAVEFIGIRSLPVVLMTSAFSGMVLALQIFEGFARFGAENLVGTVVGYALVRELAPVLAALMVAGRAGAAMAAEMGSMRVTQQIDALYALSANPIRYLVVPRIWAGIVAMPMLVIIADVISVLGAYLVVVKVLGANPTLFWQRTVDYMQVWDVMTGLIKAIVFGAIIAFMACFEGYTTKGGAQGVGRATTRAVVGATTLILASNYFLTYLMV